MKRITHGAERMARRLRPVLTLCAMLSALCVAPPAFAASTPKDRSATCLTGSSFGCLDKIPIVHPTDNTRDLVTGDKADVDAGGIRYFYIHERHNPPKKWTVAGPSCDSFDVIGKDIELPEPQVGDRFLIPGIVQVEQPVVGPGDEGKQGREQDSEDCLHGRVKGVDICGILPLRGRSRHLRNAVRSP